MQDTSTKKCTIVDKADHHHLLATGKVFKTRTAAETGMKTMKVCAN